MTPKLLAILTLALISAGERRYSDTPGVDAIKCWPENAAQRWVCKAACWLPGNPMDGGATVGGGTIHSSGRTKEEAIAELWRQYRNGCKP